MRAAIDIAGSGDPLIVVAQTNEQVDDLVVRLADQAPDLSIGRLSAQDYQPADRIVGRPNVSIAPKVGELPGCRVIIGTAAKWATVTDRTWPWAIVDEAYQMRSDMLLRIANRFDRALFVGDPGQLDPFSTVELDRWIGLTWDPMQSAVAVLLRHNPDLPVYRLPVSWRLPPSAVPVVAEAFYPFTGFDAGHRARSSGAWSWRRPRRETPLDRDASTSPPRPGGRCTSCRPGTRCAPTPRPPGRAPRSPCGCWQRGVVAHSERVTRRRASGDRGSDRDRRRPPRSGRDDPVASSAPPGAGITVDTANRLQGREYDVTVVLHPLSGRRDATAFHLESGRLCVLTSRHRHACIVVARAGIPELLDAHPSTEPVHLNVPAKFPDGWEANHAMMAKLESHRVRA